MERQLSSLLFAAEAGDAQLVARLLCEGRDVNEADEFGCTALILALQKGHVVVVRLLLARQSGEVNKRAANGYTALILASQNGHVEMVRLLLARQSVEVNKSAANGYTARAALVVPYEATRPRLLPAVTDANAPRRPGRRGAKGAGAGAAQADGRAGARNGAARQEQRRPAPAKLYVVGLGLGDEKDITVTGLWPCIGPFEAFDSAVGRERSAHGAQTTKVARGR
jgi:hypothetical protein